MDTGKRLWVRIRTRRVAKKRRILYPAKPMVLVDRAGIDAGLEPTISAIKTPASAQIGIHVSLPVVHPVSGTVFGPCAKRPAPYGTSLNPPVHVLRWLAVDHYRRRRERHLRRPLERSAATVGRVAMTTVRGVSRRSQWKSVCAYPLAYEIALRVSASAGAVRDCKL